MLDALILVQATPGKAAMVAEEMRSIECVTEAQTVTGPYDMIARVRVGNFHELELLTTTRLKTLDGVLRILASTVVPGAEGVGLMAAVCLWARPPINRSIAVRSGT